MRTWSLDWFDTWYLLTMVWTFVCMLSVCDLWEWVPLFWAVPKGDKPRQFEKKNWRPITLLNVLCNMISGCISNRLKYILDSIISDTESGFIKGRYIGENTRFIYGLMYYSESHSIPGLLILIEFEKSIRFHFLGFYLQVLQYFNFGNYIIYWVKILNTNFNAAVLRSGFLSKQFLIQRGCRQGDPLAPYLFLLCAEFLSVLIKQKHEIRGIVIRDKEYTISQYADDTTLTLKLDGSLKIPLCCSRHITFIL